MNEINNEFLLCALTDKKLSPNDFRLLIFISTFGNITTQAIIKNIGIKNPKLEVYEYSFEKLPTSRPIAISDNGKAMY